MHRQSNARYYHIELYPKEAFIAFATHNVGGGRLKRITGKKPSGQWETVGWLVDKRDAHVSPYNHLIIDHMKARTVLESVYGPIEWRHGDFFKAIPRFTKPLWSVRHSLANNNPLL